MDLESALAELAPQLLRYAIARTGDFAIAEEASQDALTALVARWRRLGPPRSPAAFAFAIARRRAARAILKRRLLEPLTSLLDGRNGAARPEHDPAVRIELRETLAALRRLPVRDRDALAIAMSGDLDPREAARRAGVTPATFRMRLHRARRRLRALKEEPR